MQEGYKRKNGQSNNDRGSNKQSTNKNCSKSKYKIEIDEK